MKPERERATRTPLCVNGAGFNGVLSVSTGRKRNTRGQLGDALRCVYKRHISARYHDVPPGDKRLLFIW